MSRAEGDALLFTVDRIGKELSPRAIAVDLRGVLKKNSDDSSREVANEYICSRLGLMLGLPVPAGELIILPDGAGYLSLRFGDRESPPPVLDTKRIAREQPDLLAGAVAFDGLIDNGDRFYDNLAYAPEHGIELTLFDHGAALFGPDDPPEPSLEGRVGRDIQRTQLTDAVEDGETLLHWARRISHLNDATIRRVVYRAVDHGALSGEDARKAVDFLRFRRNRLPEILRKSESLSHVNWPRLE